MRETIAIQVGQCGNQIGNRFWSYLLKEHENTPDTDDALSAFFRFAPQSDGRTYAMKARALLIDMECGPLQETMRSPLGSLFEETQYIMDVSGSGNNFAHGFAEYGPKYRGQFEESIRRVAEQCDSLQTFVLTHSLGGGTGSGVGSYLLGVLHDNYPGIYRFSACVFPAEDDDVVTSPYNSILATHQLIEHADCVLPIDNHALQMFAELEAAQQKKKKTPKTDDRAPGGIPAAGLSRKSRDKGFDDMNAVAARMLCHLTSSSRFHGDMNVDMNEICTNLVPFPKMHFLMSALSPQRASSGAAPAGGAVRHRSGGLAGRGAMQRAFADVLSAPGQLSGADPTLDGCMTISSAFLARGPVTLSDLLTSVTAAQSGLRFPAWNENACKIGMCGTPAPGELMSVLGIFNSTAFGSVLLRERTRFSSLFRRRAMLHHYTAFIDAQDVAEAEQDVLSVIQAYNDIERGLPRAAAWAGADSVLGQTGTADGRCKPLQLFPSF